MEIRVEITESANKPTALTDVFITARENLEEIVEALEMRELYELPTPILRGIESVVQALWELKAMVV